MQIVINSTDTLEALLVARNTINDLLARRSPDKPAAAPQSATSAPAQVPAKDAPSEAPIQVPPAPEAPKNKPGRKPAVAKTVSAEEVRLVMVAKSQEGKREAVLEALESFGCKKLSEVPPEKLVELKRLVEAL